MALHRFFIPWTTWLTVVLLAALACRGQETNRRRVHVDRSKLGMVVCNSPIASKIGADVLTEGGTAVDAAVATAFAMAVTWPEAGNIGGGGFMLVHPGGDAPTKCIDYREMAPGKAHQKMYSPRSSTLHPLAVGVPGTVRGLETAHQRYGKLPWRRLVEPAVKLAGEGFVVDRFLAGSINGVLAKSSAPQFAELRRIFGRPDGAPWQAGQQLVQPDLSRTLEKIAEHGAKAFYEGDIADQLVAEMERGGGWINRDDLAAYRAKVREPVKGRYRGCEIFGAPPPASGGLCTVLTMNMLEPYRLREHGRFSARTLHLTAEAMRRSFLERARSLGDPDFVAMPNYLTDKPFAHRLASDISPNKASSSEALAPEIRIADESPSTTHFSVIDGNGMAVANTYTLEASWGSRVVVRGAGFVLNNEMGDFNWAPGVTNRRGRIGTEANLIAPHKRMLSSQSPTIVTRNGRPLLITGSPGGRTIINTVVSILLNVLEFEMSIEEAITIRRMHHQWLPDELVLEAGDDPKLADAVKKLKAMGHRVRTRTTIGSAHSIWIDQETGVQVGVADWRRGGAAVGVRKPPR